MPNRALILALAKALDRIEQWQSLGDDDMAVTVAGAVVIILSHPDAIELVEDVEWRELLKRWRAMRARTGARPVQAIGDYAVDLASVLLVEAHREVARAAA